MIARSFFDRATSGFLGSCVFGRFLGASRCVLLGGNVYVFLSVKVALQVHAVAFLPRSWSLVRAPTHVYKFGPQVLSAKELTGGDKPQQAAGRRR